MGMFDEINSTLAERLIKKCPTCEHTILEQENTWQTKDFDNILKVLDLEDITDNFEMHTICSHCGRYISAHVLLEEGKLDIEMGYTKHEKEFEDKSLVTEYNTNNILNTINKANKTLSKLNSKWSLSRNELAEFLHTNSWINDADVSELLDDITNELYNNFYIIPK